MNQYSPRDQQEAVYFATKRLVDHHQSLYTQMQELGYKPELILTAIAAASNPATKFFLEKHGAPKS